MAANNLLFWISLATGVIALCCVALLKVARRSVPEESPQVADLPKDVDQGRGASRSTGA